MVLNNGTLDPYHSVRGYYECQECGERTTSEEPLTSCPSCDGPVQNIAVARE